MIPDPEPWTERALCASIGGDWWFPDHGNSKDAKKAVNICAGCPVKRECRDQAIANGEQFGIWGGVGERERRKMMRHEPVTRPACGTANGYYLHRNNQENTCAPCLAAKREEMRLQRSGGAA